MNEQRVYDALQTLDLKPLNKVWAKIEIILGLACVFLGMMLEVAPNADWHPFGKLGWLSLAFGLLLFVLGGYLALAGHRSHLYQSSNRVTAFLVQEIRNRKQEPF